MSQEVSRIRLQAAWHERYGMSPEESIRQGAATLTDWLEFVANMRLPEGLPYELQSPHARIVLLCRMRDLVTFGALVEEMGLTQRSIKAITLTLLKDGYLTSRLLGKELFFGLTPEGYDLARKLKEVENGQ